MNRKELLIELEELVRKYLDNEEIIDNLIKNIEPTKVKYILGEIDRHKIKEYSLEDRELIKEIYFNFC